MDIKKSILKLLSPDTYTERAVFVALGIYCIDRVLFPFANIDYLYLKLMCLGYVPVIIIDSGIMFLNNLVAIFSIILGAIFFAKFSRKFKSSILIKGLFGLGIWLIADGLFLIIPLLKGLYIFKMAFTFGVGIVLMIGVIKRGSVKKEMGLFLLGFYFLLSMTPGMTSGWGYNFFIFFRFAHPILLLVAGVLLIFRRSDESIIADDIKNDISNLR